MKKTVRLFLSRAILAALLACMQISAFASLTSPANDEAVSITAEEAPLADTARTDTVNNNEVSAINNEVTLKDINPISANPETGSENLAIPAVVALLAASTAAIAISVKKKD